MIFGKKMPYLNNRKKISVQIDEFDGGVNVSDSETRIAKNEAKEATNMLLDENGVWTKRWGTADYGPSFTNTIDGFTEYRKTDGTRELIVLADGYCYRVDPIAGTKTQIGTTAFTVGYPADFVQIKDVLYMVNGEDAMAVYNGTTISTYAGISTPSWDATPIARGAGLSAGSFTYYYRVSAVNEVGETVASTEQSITVNKARDAWVLASNEYVTLGWADVTNALKYIVYFSDTSGYEVKLAEVTTSTFQDDGTYSVNPYIEPSEADTTVGPKFKSITISNNRLWGTNDPSHPQRVYFSGTGVYLGNFSPSYGGGWLELERGGKEQCVAVEDYQNIAQVFNKTDNGRGSITKVVLTSITIAGESVIVPVPDKIIAKKGTPAPRGVALVENDLYFLNKEGIHTLGDVSGIYNKLRTDKVSDKLNPYFNSLHEASLIYSCSYYFDGLVFFSVPTVEGQPNRTIVYERSLKAWMKDWTIGVSQFGEYTDVNGITRLLGIKGNQLIEFNESYKTDSGTSFYWKYVSPRFAISNEWDSFGKIKRAFVKLRNATGSINVTVDGTPRDDITQNVGAETIVINALSTAGIGWDKVGTVKVGDTAGSPSNLTVESIIRYVEIRELIRDMQWTITGSGASDSCGILGIKATGNLVKVANPESWRLD